MHIKGRKKSTPIILKEKLNDGQWHNVEIFKRKRKVTIILDGEQKKIFKVPKNVVKNEIYLGGIPVNSDYLNVNDLVRLIVQGIQVNLHLKFHIFRKTNSIHSEVA